MLAFESSHKLLVGEDLWGIIESSPPFRQLFTTFPVARLHPRSQCIHITPRAPLCQMFAKPRVTIFKKHCHILKFDSSLMRNFSHVDNGFILSGKFEFTFFTVKFGRLFVTLELILEVLICSTCCA